MSVHNSVTRAGEAIRWLLLAIIPIGTLGLLLAMPPPLALDQLDGGSLEEVLLAAGRWLGIAIAVWIVTSQLLYTVAVLTRTDWMITILQPVTLPIVKRIAAGAASITISLSSVSAVAQSPPEPTVTSIVDEGPTLRQEATPTPILQPLVEHETRDECKTLETESTPEPEGSYSAPLIWQVRPGDNLWSIAEEHLTIVLDRPPTRDEHRRYWVEVMEAAKPVIRSDDVNLIYPGEEIPLPPMIDAGITP